MTTLRPAFETILRHGDHAVTLRASLRAAVAIDLLDGGFPAVLERLAGQSYTATCAVIRASATDRQQAERFIAAAGCTILQGFLPRAQAACLQVIAHVLPTPDAQTKPSSTTHTETTGKPWGEHFATLYGYATGWLRWPPETAWNASIQEIESAFTAHVNHLIAINGGKRDEVEIEATTYTPESLAEIEELGFDPAFDRAGLRALQARST